MPDQISEPNAAYFPTGSFLGDGGWQVSTMLGGGDLGENSLTSTSYCAKLGKDVVTRGDTTSTRWSGTITDLTAVVQAQGDARLWRLGDLSTGTDVRLAIVFRSLKPGKRSWKVTGEDDDRHRHRAR